MNSFQVFVFIVFLCFISIILLHFSSIHSSLEDEKSHFLLNQYTLAQLALQNEKHINSTLSEFSDKLQKELEDLRVTINTLKTGTLQTLRESPPSSPPLTKELTTRESKIQIQNEYETKKSIPWATPIPDTNTSSISVLLWEFPGGENWAGFGRGPLLTEPNYLGQIVEKYCDIGCMFTGDKGKLPNVDAVMFESSAYGGSPGFFDLQYPMKRPWQQWISFGYEHHKYFPLSGEKIWTENMDVNMTFMYYGNNPLPITLTCSWGGGNLIEDLERQPNLSKKTKFSVWIATNCAGGGATGRTEYMKEILKHVPVDCPGKCLHNFDLPPEWQGKIYDDHGKSMRNKIKLFESYKFIFVFENNNITDYVTEKIWNAYQAGSVPIYMGAPNIDDWIPDPSSIIRTDQFKNAKELALYLKEIELDEEKYLSFFEWKKLGYDGWSESFKQKYKDCVFHNSECRLCHYLKTFRETQEKEKGIVKHIDHSFSLYLSGLPYLEMITSNWNSIFDDISQELSVVGWIQATRIKDYRIVDKNTAGVIDGWSIDLFNGEATHGNLGTITSSGVLRLCGGDGCRTGRMEIYPNFWYHIAVVYSLSSSTCSFYVNGFLDSFHTIERPLAKNDYKLRLGGSSRSQGKDIASKWQGNLDEISVWNRPLSQNEINQLRFNRFFPLRSTTYSSSPSSSKTTNTKYDGKKVNSHINVDGLLGYWTFDDGQGTIVNDNSMYQNNFNIIGVPSWIEAEIKPAYLGSHFDISFKKKISK